MFECSLGVNQWFINLKYFISRTEFLSQVTQEKVLVGLRKENLSSHQFVHRSLLSWENCIRIENPENMIVT